MHIDPDTDTEQADFKEKQSASTALHGGPDVTWLTYTRVHAVSLRRLVIRARLTGCRTRLQGILAFLALGAGDR